MKVGEVEARLRSRTGKILTVEVSLRYVEIDGELCTMCIGRDISPRIAAERARRESEAKFSRIFSESPDGILIVRQNDLTVCDVNEAFLNTSGYEREELVDQGVVTLSGIIDREAFNEAIKGFNAEGRLLNEEMPLRTKTGEFIPTLVSATRIELHGEACALCITKDIQDLRETERRLKDSESRFRGAFENAPIGIMLVDADGRIFEANRFAADLLAYDLKSLEGRHISRLIPAEERGQFRPGGVHEFFAVPDEELHGLPLHAGAPLGLGLQHDPWRGPERAVVQKRTIRIESPVSAQV